MTALTHCKTATCRKAITTSNVINEQPVDGSPQHIVVEYKCPACGKTDRMVGTIESWREFKDEESQVAVERKAALFRTEKAAHIEVNAISNVDDLITLWRSYRRPPLREAVMGSCQCDECEGRRLL